MLNGSLAVLLAFRVVSFDQTQLDVYGTGLHVEFDGHGVILDDLDDAPQTKGCRGHDGYDLK